MNPKKNKIKELVNKFYNQTIISLIFASIAGVVYAQYMSVGILKTPLATVSSALLASAIVHWTTRKVFLASLTEQTDDLMDYLKNTFSLPRTYVDQDAADLELQEDIRKNNFKKADLLEFSSYTIKDSILKPLNVNTAEIRLLLQNPLIAEERFDPFPYELSEKPRTKQRRRICETFCNLQEEFFKGQGLTTKISIHFYDQMASLRGRNFDDKYLNVGWYTYDYSKSRENEKYEQVPVQIHGHTNHLITLTRETPNFDGFKGFFSRVFDSLWDKSHEPMEICGNCKYKTPIKCGVNSDWVEKLSPESQKKKTEKALK
ncbi:MAG: hypothetical protein HY665_06545 [Chloroflexi bacterium]|nr:hypothetical protein [Chloroflexota bacterium]